MWCHLLNEKVHYCIFIRAEELQSSIRCLECQYNGNTFSTITVIISHHCCCFWTFQLWTKNITHSCLDPWDSYWCKTEMRHSRSTTILHEAQIHLADISRISNTQTSCPLHNHVNKLSILPELRTFSTSFSNSWLMSSCKEKIK